MKLYNEDFKRVMAAYKAIKIVLKTTDASVTFNTGKATVNTERLTSDTVVSVDIDSTLDKQVTLTSTICDMLIKCKIKEDLIIDNRIKIGDKEIPKDLPTTDTTDKIHIDTSDYKSVFNCNAANFKRNLKSVAAARHKEDYRPTLQCVAIEQGKMYATDSIIVVSRDLWKTETGDIWLIKPHTADTLLKLLPNNGDTQLTLMRTGDKACYVFGDYTIYDSLENGVGLNVLSITNTCEKDAVVKVTVNTQSLRDALDLDAAIQVDDVKYTKLSLNDSTLKVGLSVIDCEIEGNPAAKEWGYNLKKFKDITKYIDDEQVTIMLPKGALEPCIIKYNKGLSLIMPVRLSK